MDDIPGVYPDASAERSAIRVSEVLSALSYALDLTEGHAPGHALRSAVIGMRLAEAVEVPEKSRSALYYALLIQDAGCGEGKLDWSLDEPAAPQSGRRRGERGASIAQRIGLGPEAVEAVAHQDETWDGRGERLGLAGDRIPILSRILLLSQSLDNVYSVCGADVALELALRRSGTWFDPELVRAFLQLACRGRLWAEVDRATDLVPRLEPQAESITATPESIDRICLAFAAVIDAKSPFTFRHSFGVADTAVAISRTMGVPRHEIALLWRAALLHDIGKLGVPNSILDKPGRLTTEEWAIVRRHPYYSHEILGRIPGFAALADLAGAHHERLDGSGYFRGRSGAQLSRLARILAIADVHDALAAKRPYRDRLPTETVLKIIGSEVPTGLDPDCFEALKLVSGRCGPVPPPLALEGWTSRAIQPNPVW